MYDIPDDMDGVDLCTYRPPEKLPCEQNKKCKSISLKGYCENKCWIFDEGTCPTPECEWKNSNCEAKMCYLHTDNPSCNDVDGCKWDPKQQKCLSNFEKCDDIYDEDKCPTKMCTWATIPVESEKDYPNLCITDPDYKEEDSVNKPNLNSKPTTTPNTKTNPNPTPTEPKECSDICGLVAVDNGECDDSCLKPGS